MKGVCDRSGYAAVLFDKTIKRLDCFGVPKDYGDLTALGAEGCLPLRAGFGFGHGSDLDVAERNGFLGRDPDAISGAIAANLKDGGVGCYMGNPVHVREVLPDAGGDFAQDRIVSGEGRNLIREVAAADEGGHFVLRVGPIPTMCLSYTVTSDNATTVRRELAA